MALVIRNGRTYAYRSVRRGGRVTSRYLGSGSLALLWEMVGRHDAMAGAEERAERREARQAEAERGRALIDRLDRRADAGIAAAVATLEAAGCHRHKGQWRRRRRRRTAMGIDPSLRAALTGPHTLEEPAGGERSEYWTPTGIGEATTYEAASYGWPYPPPPDLLPLRRQLDEWIVESVSTKVSGGIEEARMHEADIRAFAGRLAGPDPEPIEEALALQAALIWFEMTLARGQAWNECGSRQRVSDEQIQRFLDRCHRRFDQTLRTLATVRKLAVSVQVNIAANGPQQVVNGRPGRRRRRPASNEIEHAPEMTGPPGPPPRAEEHPEP